MTTFHTGPHAPEGYRLVRKRAWYQKKRFLIPFGFLMLIVAVSAFSAAGGNSDSADATGTTRGGATRTSHRLGTAVRDGKFQFVVKSFTCGLKRAGNQYVSRRAQGQFCVATMTVKNTGNEPQTFVDGNQEAFAGKTKYSADSEAGIDYAIQQGRDGGDWVKEINPGNAMTGVVLFDVPRGTRPDHLVLHDSAFSGGVSVATR